MVSVRPLIQDFRVIAKEVAQTRLASVKAAAQEEAADTLETTAQQAADEAAPQAAKHVVVNYARNLLQILSRKEQSLNANVQEAVATVFEDVGAVFTQLGEKVRNAISTVTSTATEEAT